MDNKEIALQLTLKALECGKIHFTCGTEGTTEEVNAANDANAAQIINFYNTLLNSLSSKSAPVPPMVSIG